MEKQEREKVIESLEKFRTPAKPNVGHDQPFVETDFERKRHWLKRISMSAVFVLILSLSITVYANVGQFIGTKKENTANPRPQVTTKPQQKSVITGKKGSPEADEAFHLEYRQKVVKDTPSVKSSSKKKVTYKRQVPTRLSPPPQPKKQDKPALNNQPIQVPDHYRQQHSHVPPEEKQKKK